MKDGGVKKIIRFLKTDIWRVRSRDLPAAKSLLLNSLRVLVLTLRGVTEDKTMQMMLAALEGKKPITVDSVNMTDMPDLTKEANKVNVYGNHAYAVESVDLASRTVNLQNPWGSHHVADLPIKDFMRFYRAVRVGGN